MKRKNVLAKKHLCWALLAMGAATPAFADLATINTLGTFNGTNGANPYTGVILSGSTLYGTTDEYGPSAGDYGTVYSLPVTGGNITTLGELNENGNAGVNSHTGVILSADGQTLYGTTSSGTTQQQGAVFSLPVAGGTPTPIVTFTSLNGSTPFGNLILSGNNTLYGTTTKGGSGGFVFSVSGNGSNFTNVAAFPWPTAGAPWSNLILSPDGTTLYGTSQQGGNTSLNGGEGDGTVFAVTVATGHLSILANFNGTNGMVPSALILSGTTLYGATQTGGPNNAGTVFSVPTNGNGSTAAVTTLATFNNLPGDPGSGPNGLVLSADGTTLYGTTYSGGTNYGWGTIFEMPVAGGNVTTLANFNSADGEYPEPNLILAGNTLYGTAERGGTLSGINDGTVWSLVIPAAVTPTTYTLAAAVTGSRVVNGRITQGQYANLTATVNNTGGNGTDNLAYDTLTITGANGIFMTPGTGNLTSGGNGTATGTFIASTLGLNNFNPGVGNATNATIGNAATNNGSTSASVYVDALVQHINAATITDTGNANTTPTAFYRQNNSWGGDNLGNVTVTKEAPGSYVPAYVNGINGGSGTSVGTLKITVNGDDNKFGADTSIILLGFQDVNHLGTGSGSLATIEGALNTAGIEWRDYTGATSSNWPGMSGSPLDNGSMFEQVADYDIELAFAPNTLTSSQSYFDFNFTDQLGTAGDVVNIAVVPEPATLSLLAGGAGLLLRRHRRRKAA